MNTEKSEIGQASGIERDWENGMEWNRIWRLKKISP